MMNFPALLTCAVPISASASMIFEHADFFISIAVMLFIAFIAFMGAITANWRS